MNTTHPDSKQRITYILSTLNRFRFVLIAPALAAMALSVVYVTYLRPQIWSAKQSLIVRDDLLSQSFKLGRFESIESMKSAQETILEIARKPQVIRRALEQLGPPPQTMFSSGAPEQWPDEETIEGTQGSITFHAPNGAEFGKTEVIVLSTKASERERSRKFIEVLLNEIIAKVADVRTSRLESMESELTQAYEAALEAQAESKSKMAAMHRRLGPDGMISLDPGSTSGDDAIKREISQIRLEKRDVASKLDELKTVLSQLLVAQDNPDRIFTTSAAAVRLLPAIDSLKKALIKKQDEFAAVEGKFNPAHPTYQQAESAISAMKQQLYREFDSSIDGIRNDISLMDSKLSRLNQEMKSLNDRLVNLGSNRADFVTLNADWQERTMIVNNIKSDLSEVQGLAQAKNAELITPVDLPQVSTRPDGMGKKVTVLCAGFAGLMLGIGLVLILAPPAEPDNLPTIAKPQHHVVAHQHEFVAISELPAARASTGSEQSVRAAEHGVGTSWIDEMTPTEPSLGSVESEIKAREFFSGAGTASLPSVEAPEVKSRAAKVRPASPVLRESIEASSPEVAAVDEPTPMKRSEIPVERNQAPVPRDEKPANHRQAVEPNKFDSKPRSIDELAAIQMAALRRELNADSREVGQKPGKRAAPREMASSHHETPIVQVSEIQTQNLALADDKGLAEMTRRGPSVRPVELANSVEDFESPFSHSPTATGTRNAGQTANATMARALDTMAVTQSKPKPMDPSPEPADPMAVPDQIRQLSDSIARFMNSGVS